MIALGGFKCRATSSRNQRMDKTSSWLHLDHEEGTRERQAKQVLIQESLRNQGLPSATERITNCLQYSCEVPSKWIDVEGGSPSNTSKIFTCRTEMCPCGTSKIRFNSFHHTYSRQIPSYLRPKKQKQTEDTQQGKAKLALVFINQQFKSGHHKVKTQFSISDHDTTSAVLDPVRESEDYTKVAEKKGDIFPSAFVRKHRLNSTTEVKTKFLKTVTSFTKHLKPKVCNKQNIFFSVPDLQNLHEGMVKKKQLAILDTRSSKFPYRQTLQHHRRFQKGSFSINESPLLSKQFNLLRKYIRKERD